MCGSKFVKIFILKGMNYMKAYGEKVWLIPDGFISGISHCINSHDAVCVINTSEEDATIKLTLYFEDRDKMDCFFAECKSNRTHHIRMDKLMGKQPDIMINLSASPFDYIHADERKSILKRNVLKYKLPIVYCNTTGSQTEIIFDGLFINTFLGHE